jgi:formylglycine-generating enzyme required for sulfatase activity/phage replication-related protein YjqB (UPF0714/DUF867 family)
MIERLVAVLAQKFKDLTAEEIADILWLTLQQWQSGVSEVQSLVSDPATEDLSGLDAEFSTFSQVPPLPGNVSDPGRETRQKKMAGLTTSGSQIRHQSETTAAPGAPLAIPDATALRGSLDLLRALRPLIRKVPSTEAKFLDVPATVQTIAETELWLLQLRPVLEPWLELAIVVDASASMVIWQRTILILRRVLAQSGVFRDVRMWSLETQDSADVPANEPKTEPQLCIRSGFGSSSATQPACRPQELIDPSGRRLILVISDCIDARWDTQQIRDFLQVWANHGPMALVQVLPEWLWSRTALNQVAKGQMYSLSPGQASQSLTFVRRERWRRKPSVGVKVPVVTLEPAVATRWSHMVAGKASVSAPGLLFSPVNSQSSSLKQESDSQVQAPTLTPQKRLEQFRNFSSPMARRLAGLLAACPEVNLPIIRMVQAAILRESQQVHVAEVLLGGLFKPQAEITAHTPADQVQYVFHDGVRPLVQDTVPPDYAFAALSAWLNNRFGYSLEDFRAYVTPERIEQVKPFAGVLLDVLKRRGRDYAEIVERIEQIYQPRYRTFSELAEQETSAQDYEIRSCVGRSGIAVLAIHGGNLQPGTTQIAEAVAGDLHSFYSFVSFKPEIDQTLYIPSTQFDEVTALEIVSAAQIVLSIHGCQGRTEFISVGGLDRDHQELIRAELQQAGFTVLYDDSAGTGPISICNRGRTGQGIELEISRGLRDRLINASGGIEDAARLNQLVEVLQRSLTILMESFSDETELSWSNFPELEPFNFTDAQLIDSGEPDLPATFPPPLHTEQFTIATITLEPEPDGSAAPDLQPFDFTVATLQRRSPQQQRTRKARQQQADEWVTHTQQQRAYRFIEPLTDDLTLEMVAIPGGTFLMGSPDDEPDRTANESPQHEVTVASFFMGRYPVTQVQWRFVASLPQVDRTLTPGPSVFKGDRHPVEKVSWYDAVEFCARLSTFTDRLYRLPTEAEWEYACRAGTVTPFHFGEMITTKVANYQGSAYAGGPEGEGRGETTPVDHFGMANAFGLSDMHGNVLEWCQDYWHGNYEDAPTDGSVWIEGGDSARRVIRGGAWLYLPRHCRSAYRNSKTPDNQLDGIGFRVCCLAPRTL